MPLLLDDHHTTAHIHYFRDERDRPAPEPTFFEARPSSTVRTRAAKLSEQKDSSAFVDTGERFTNMSVLDWFAVGAASRSR